MAPRLYSETAQGRFVPAAPAAPPDEDTLQRILADHPELLSETEPLLLVAREQAVQDSDGAQRWALDHLFVTRSAVPVLVEVKRASDTRLRREVVGQLLDYAANGVAYWPAGELRTRQAARPGGTEALAQFLDGDDADTFWSKVDRNLAAGHMQLVVLADVIPRELARVLEFLNEQMRAEVIGVELRYFQREDGRRILAPRIVGRTERAQAARPTEQSVEGFLAERVAPNGAEVERVARAFIAALREAGAILTVTSRGTLQGALPVPGGTAKPVDLRSGAGPFLEFKLGHARHLDGDARQAWLDAFQREIGGLSHSHAERYPTCKLSHVAEVGKLAEMRVWLGAFAADIASSSPEGPQ